MQARLVRKNSYIGAVSGLVAAIAIGIHSLPVKAEDFNAGSVLQRLKTEELTAYITGIVHGLAYARYQNGGKEGRNCVLGWFATKGTASQIVLAFDKYKEHQPDTIIAAMIKQQCGK